MSKLNEETDHNEQEEEEDELNIELLQHQLPQESQPSISKNMKNLDSNILGGRK